MLAIRELYVGLTATAAVSSAAVFWLHFSRFSTRGVRWWALGIFSFFISLALMTLRGMLHPGLTVALSNVLAVCGYLFVWLGIRIYLERPLNKRVVGLGVSTPLLVGGMNVLSLVFPALIPARISLLCLVFILLNLCLVRELFYGTPGRRTAKLLAVNYLINAGFIAFRGVNIWVTGSYDAYYTTGWTTAGYVLWTLICLMVMTLGLMIMMVEDLSNTLSRRAVEDPLTGLFNRRAFHEISPASFGDAATGLLLLDIDHFKQVNDTWGHGMGDEMLTHFAREVGQCLRSGDLFYRIGGEEFVVVLPGMGPCHIGAMAERIRARVETHPLRTSQETIPLTVSIGCAALTASDPGMSPVLDRADVALYQAKNRGRNRVEVNC